MIPSIRFEQPEGEKVPDRADPEPGGAKNGTMKPKDGPELPNKTRIPSTSSTSTFSGSDSDTTEDKTRLGANGWNTFTRNTRRLSNTATHMIIKVPVKMRKVAELDGVSSLDRETKHFVSITAMHGVKRVYDSRGLYKLFWATMVVLCAGVLIQQLQKIIESYHEQPITTQMEIKRMRSSFGGSEALDEVLFPKITICNFNPIRKSYIRHLNASGDFSLDVLRYLMLFNNDVLTTYGNGNEVMLSRMDKELREYEEMHPNFTFHRFFYDAGFRCEDILKSCSFAGRPFDCCKYSSPRLTSLGRCHEIALSHASVEWMKKQTEGGDKAGLQLVLDTHLNEQVKDIQDNDEAVLSNQFENGFRFYVVEPETSTYTSSQGINVSPGSCVYSALVAKKYELLKPEEWGNCTDEWPKSYSGNNTKLKYQSLDCMTKCKARTFNEKCGCSPFIYDIDNEYSSCSPFQTYLCMKKHILINVNETSEEFSWPACDECKAECQKWEFLSYNSYSHGFTGAALSWLQARNANWTAEVVKSNFLTINVFFRDMSYSVFRQEQASSLVQTLSNMGGTMGLFLGMSVLTMIESVIYICKAEMQETDETIKTIRGIGSNTLKDAMEQLQGAAGTIKRWRPKFSVSGKPSSKPSTPVGPPPVIQPWAKQSKKMSTTSDISAFTGYDNDTFHDDVFEPEKKCDTEVIELAINLKDLKREIRKQSGIEMDAIFVSFVMEKSFRCRWKVLITPLRKRSTSYKSPAIGRRKQSDRPRRRNMSLSGPLPSDGFYNDGPPTPGSSVHGAGFTLGPCPRANSLGGPNSPKVPSPLAFSSSIPHISPHNTLEPLPPMAEDSEGEEAARSRRGSKEGDKDKPANSDSIV
ncbi:hypothetical protein PRIPAC_83892 [Pristionchus pacificus]|uniref:Ion channel n=1 Tax=Pristionchus pacificus TaxID=54126 RepID=A0A2A6CCH1_PRIPA|nr:hypothetical protein PRIPAC_83892 [Pristionchus pacificus]|eukprot:PDM75816.1 ion channel [Pristionchus pacificus]